MTNHQLKTIQRQKATAVALASVRAEGLEPSAATKKRLAQYVQGVISVEQLQRQTLEEVKVSAQPLSVS